MPETGIAQYAIIHDEEHDEKITFLVSGDVIHLSDGQIVAISNSAILRSIAVGEEDFELDRISLDELQSVKLYKRFSFMALLIGFGSIGLGAGWFILFFIGIIPIIFYVIAGAMILFGFVCLVTIIETCAKFNMKDGTALYAKGIGGSGKNIMNMWMNKNRIRPA